jgi:HK97 family phage prohead protease
MLHIKADYLQANEAGTYTFRASTAAVDRQGEVIVQQGWDLGAYKVNPVILDSHRYGSIDDILGKASRVEVMPEGLEIDVQFAPTAKGQMAQQLVDDGMLSTVSVGFRSKARRPGQRSGEPMTHTAMELLEVSMVAIPANREAVRLRGVEDNDVTDEAKGRRKSTADKIRAAMAMLAEMLEDHFEEMGQMPDSGMKPGHYGKPDEEPMKGLTIPDDVAASLAAFAKEATNG